MATLHYEKSIDVRKSYDVIVAGAGPTGICAAVAAAREGAKVALVERYGVVGGNLTAGYVGPILGMVGKGTMRDELVRLLGVPDNDMIGVTGKAHDMEQAKLVLAEFVNHENIDVYLQSSVYDVVKEGNAVKGLILATNEGHFAIMAKVVVDATGDAVVSYLAGADIEKGREDGLMQPVTLEFTIAGVDEEKGVICIGDVDDVKLGDERFLDFCKRCADEGKLPQKLAAVRLHPTTKSGERQVNTTQVNGVDVTEVASVFDADLELRRQIKLLMDFFHENLPGYENCRCIASGTTTGVRETRRVMGDYVITAEEQQRWDAMLADYDKADAAVETEQRFVDIQRKQAEDRYQQLHPDNKHNEERETAEYRSAFSDYILNGANGISAESRTIISQRDKLAGLSAGVLIPTDLASSIEVALKNCGGMFEAGELFHTSRGGDLVLPTINDTDAKAVIVAEYTQNTRRTPTFSSVTLKAHTYRTPTIPISEELMQDSAFNLDAVLTNLMSESFGRGINEHLTIGTGTGQPNGIVTCATACADKAAANAITLDNILNLMKSVDAAYARNGKFMFNRNTLYEFMRIKDQNGRFIWQEGTRDGLPATLFGKQYIINDDVADIGAGKASVLFGDLKKYKIRMVKSFRVLRLNELLAEYLSIGLLGFARVDGTLLDAGTNPVKKLVHAAS